MNEQTKIIWDNCVRNYGHAGQETCAKMFAKLLIQDCIGILEYRNNHPAVVNSIREIKEHFGVE